MQTKNFGYFSISNGEVPMRHVHPSPNLSSPTTTQLTPLDRAVLGTAPNLSVFNLQHKNDNFFTVY
jgi:hypothetical protein